VNFVVHQAVWRKLKASDGELGREGTHTEESFIATLLRIAKRDLSCESGRRSRYSRRPCGVRKYTKRARKPNRTLSITSKGWRAAACEAAMSSKADMALDTSECTVLPTSATRSPTIFRRITLDDKRYLETDLLPAERIERAEGKLRNQGGRVLTLPVTSAEESGEQCLDVLEVASKCRCVEGEHLIPQLRQ
jgi:hypothetical protein